MAYRSDMGLFTGAVVPGLVRRLAVLSAVWVSAFPGLVSGADTPEPPPPVVITGNPSVLHLKPPLDLAILSRFYRQSEACASFTVRARSGELPQVTVTTSGLGSAVLSDAGSPQVRQPSFEIKKLTATGSSLNLCVPGALVPNSGDSVEGKIVVLASSAKPVEVPLKLDRPGSDPPTAALQWFLALLIPALLTYWIARLTAYQTQRAKQVARFASYRDLAYLDLRDFFGIHYATLHKQHAEDQEFSEALEKALREQRIWSRIPDKERGQLVKCLRRARRKEAGALLARQFPDWRRQIENPGA